jgi:hypothetical protein
MRTIKKVEVTPVYVNHIPDNMEFGKIYISNEYHTANHLCLCGCGGETVTPLIGSGWKLTEKDGKISLTPSILNGNYECKSHYIITNNIANFV